MTDSVPTSVVEKLITTVVELTKQVTSMPHTISSSMSNDIDKVTTALTKVADRMNMPPRNEELEALLKELKITTSNTNQAIKSTMRTIKIITGLFGLAILVASIVMYFGNVVDNRVPHNDNMRIEKQIEELKGLIEKNHGNP